MVDARQQWPGGAATAVVAALIALVGILVCRWLFSIPVLAPRQDGVWGDASTAGYAAAAALVATTIMHLLLIATPRPRMFFTWIIGLATVIAVVYLFSTAAPLSQKAATAVINLVFGAAIGSLINETAARVMRRRAITGGYQRGPASGGTAHRGRPGAGQARRNAGGESPSGHGQDHAGTPRPDALIPALGEGQLAALREIGREGDRVSAGPQVWRQALPVDPSLGEYPEASEVRRPYSPGLCLP